MQLWCNAETSRGTRLVGLTPESLLARCVLDAVMAIPVEVSFSSKVHLTRSRDHVHVNEATAGTELDARVQLRSETLRRIWNAQLGQRSKCSSYNATPIVFDLVGLIECKMAHKEITDVLVLAILQL